MQVNLKFHKPKLFGVLMVANMDQAKARSGLVGEENSGFEWGKSAIESIALLKKYGEPGTSRFETGDLGGSEKITLG